MKDCNPCNNEENFPDGTVKAQDGKCFLMVNGKWKQMTGTVNVNLPESPIDVASMLINATVTNDLPNEKIPLSPLLEQKTWEIPKYDILQLEEIAKHILLYCETKRKGYEDAFSENHKPQPL